MKVSNSVNPKPLIVNMLNFAALWKYDSIVKESEETASTQPIHTDGSF